MDTDIDHSEPAPRRWATVGLMLLLVVGVVLVTGSVLVRVVVLDPDTYTEALAENRAYDRVYTEVLADPELADLVDSLLGDVAVVGLAPTQARAKATAVLRWTLPPEVLQARTEAGIESVLGYIRGDTDELSLSVDVIEVFDRVDDGAIREARLFLADAADSVAASAPAYLEAVVAFADDLAQGVVPDSIPKVGGTTFDPDAVIAAIVALQPDIHAETRLLVESLVVSGNDRDALITVASELIAGHATESADRLRAETDEQFRYDVVAAIAEASNRTQADVEARLDPARTAARLLGWPSLLFGVLLVAGALWQLVRLRSRAGAHPAVIVGRSLAVAGAIVLLGWWLLAALTDSPLQPAVGDGSGLPAGLRSVLADVNASIVAEVTRAVRRVAAVLILGGAAIALVGAALSGVRVTWLSPTRAALGASVAALIVLGGVALAADRSADAADEGCNGHVELCDRAYDEVVYAATHNSMSSPDVVAIWPEHDGDMRAQLDAGVRALLIDALYWQPVASESAVRALDPFITPELAARLWQGVEGLREAHPGTFLCHGHCAFGSQPLIEGLTSVREFLDDNPREVVTLIIQDEITPEDAATAVTDAGLAPYLHGHAVGEPWPTLGQMVDSGERLVVFAENEGFAPGWYLPAFDLMQETPFLALSPGALSCDPNRGDLDASLFLMNHWVQRIAPDRVDSVVINAHDFVVERAMECAQVRGQLPNFIAVNFHDLGELDRAVDTLNGVAP